ncbi:MAG: uroporphyrinogen decarboxylase [Magnetococcales bacterium]|nr:uroporphyrinogen decarboxylase [Magnetococcales bacterium]NGZ07227.1 uroporphyrinogen decarboxylase [Magnetococcales bacterium]
MPEPHHLFLRACLNLPTERTPVWIMRQAGRYLPEYMSIRQQAGDFLNLCKNPELATQVTLQPIDRFGLDAAILFSDILVVPEAMGMGLSFGSGEGPLLEPPIRNRSDLERLHPFDPEQELDYVMETIRTIRKRLDDRVPLIGFSGSPWTLATYMVEGGSSKNFSRIKGMMYDQPELLNGLLNRLVEAVTRYLNAQIRHGVQAVQIFDTWGGVLGHREFLEFSLANMQKIVAGLDKTGPDGLPVPVILFAKGCGAHLEAMAASGCHVVGLDWTTDIGEARQRVQGRVALQGNLDPAVLYASPERIRQEAARVLTAYGPHPGLIFNLGHGIAPDCHPEKVASLVQAVQGFQHESRHP